MNRTGNPAPAAPSETDEALPSDTTSASRKEAPAGPMSAGVFALCGLLGSILLLAADIFGQYALPVMLPAGVVTAAVGAPYFLVLLCRSGARIEGRNR